MTDTIQIFILILLIIFAIIALIIFLTNNAQQQAVKRANRHRKVKEDYHQPMLEFIFEEVKLLSNASDIITKCHDKATQHFYSKNPNEKLN